MTVVAGVENHRHVTLVSREKREVGVGTQGLDRSHFSSGQVIPGFTGGLQDPKFPVGPLQTLILAEN
jgi:hypothetical protein